RNGPHDDGCQDDDGVRDQQGSDIGQRPDRFREIRAGARTLALSQLLSMQQSSLLASATVNSEPVTNTTSSGPALFTHSKASATLAAIRTSLRSPKSRIVSGRVARSWFGAVAITASATGNRMAVISTTALSRIA